MRISERRSFDISRAWTGHKVFNVQRPDPVADASHLALWGFRALAAFSGFSAPQRPVLSSKKNYLHVSMETVGTLT